jgi:hypothetical protein
LVEGGFYRESKRMIMYERRPDRSWEPIVVPAALNPEIGWWISVNDRGAMGFGWSADAPNAPTASTRMRSAGAAQRWW